MNVNAILKEIKSDNVTKANRLIKACVTFMEKYIGLNQTKPKEMQ